jgi:hypothetical protein
MPRPGTGEAPAVPRASSSTEGDASGEPAEAGVTSVLGNACTRRRSTQVSAWSWRAESAPLPPCYFIPSSRVLALLSCRRAPRSRSPHHGGRFTAVGLLGRLVGDEKRSPIGDGRRAGVRLGVIPRNSTTRPPGVEERRRIEEQEEEQGHRKDPGFARPIILASASSSRVGVLCGHFANFSVSRLDGAVLEYAGVHVGLGLGERGQLTRPGTGSRGPIAVGAEIGRLGPRAPGSQFTRRSCVVRRDATRTGRPAGVPCERSFASFTGAVNRYNSHVVYIDVLNEVSVMPARGAQSC